MGTLIFTQGASDTGLTAGSGLVLAPGQNPFEKPPTVAPKPATAVATKPAAPGVIMHGTGEGDSPSQTAHCTSTRADHPLRGSSNEWDQHERNGGYQCASGLPLFRHPWVRPLCFANVYASDHPPPGAETTGASLAESRPFVFFSCGTTPSDSPEVPICLARRPNLRVWGLDGPGQSQ